MKPPAPNLIDDLLAEACEDIGLDDTAFRVFFVVASGIRSCGVCRLTDTALADLIGSPWPKEARRALRDLDRRGYVVRRYGPDGRFRTGVELTTCTKATALQDA